MITLAWKLMLLTNKIQIFRCLTMLFFNLSQVKISSQFADLKLIYILKWRKGLHPIVLEIRVCFLFILSTYVINIIIKCEIKVLFIRFQNTKWIYIYTCIYMHTYIYIHSYILLLVSELQKEELQTRRFLSIAFSFSNFACLH